MGYKVEAYNKKGVNFACVYKGSKREADTYADNKRATAAPHVRYVVRKT